jgi:hypothetical protein
MVRKRPALRCGRRFEMEPAHAVHEGNFQLIRSHGSKFNRKNLRVLREKPL